MILPWPLAATAMLPPTSNASPPNIFISLRSASAAKQLPALTPEYGLREPLIGHGAYRSHEMVASPALGEDRHRWILDDVAGAPSAPGVARPTYVFPHEGSTSGRPMGAL